MFEGVHTALVTPFGEKGIDAEAYRKLIDRQFENGISGVVPVGTTGESPTLSHEEHIRVIEIAVEQTKGRGKVIAGTGSNSTDEAISLTQAAQKSGATGALLVAPYYNKPSQAGLLRHFRAIADATELPLILYSIPGRCGIEIAVETVAELATSCSNVVAIKEAGGNVERVSQLAEACPADFEILSGDDSLTLPFMSVGAVGVISVASNLVPGPLAEMVKFMLEGNLGEALRIHRAHYKLFSTLLKLDSNPVPIKAALALVNACRADVRSPLVMMPEEKVSQLAELLRGMGILPAS